jgi:4-hydroxyacetophenone monooxygenase
MKREHPVEPIREDDATIARALESASIPTLMMSLIHVTGDASLLRGPIRPGRALLGDVSGGFSEAEKAEVRRLALEVLRGYRDGGCKLPPPPPPETIREMMSFMVGEPVPDEYAPMFLEEMELDGEDARALEWDHEVPAERKQAFHVLVIGAGMSGILAAIRLEEAGLPYTVVEKNPAVGGTWYENRYPGCRVDVANHFYCYSFEPSHDWSEFFSQRDELQAYFERTARAHGVTPKIRFQTEVVGARWDEAASRWQVRLRNRDGREETLAANAIVSAVGQLNRPRIPEIPGRERFAGVSFHSAQWDRSLDLTGKRVAVIGTGASAFQLVPEVAKQAAKLSVFQRSPGWMIPNPVYHARVSEGKKWLLRHVPAYARWYRFLLFWPGSDGLLPSLVIDPSWPHPERSVNALNEEQRKAFTAWYESQLEGRPDLLAKVLPSYPPFGKRILQDNGTWLATLKRENVEVVTAGIREITADAVVDEDGNAHAVDVIVFATGFHANRFLWPMQIEGRGGERIAERFGEEPRAYLGITVPGFPNLFCLYGPATNLAHAGSIIFHSECQVRYVMGCLKALVESGKHALEVRSEVHDAFNARLDERLAKMVWSHPGMSSWYKNSRGKVTTTSPWRLVDYWRWTREPDLADYHIT